MLQTANWIFYLLDRTAGRSMASNHFRVRSLNSNVQKPPKGWSNLNAQVWTTKLKSKRNKSHKYIYIVINHCNLYQRHIYINIFVFLLISLESLYVGTNQFWVWSLNEIVQRNYKTNVVKFGCMKFSIKTETIWKESVKRCVAQYVCCQLSA